MNEVMIPTAVNWFNDNILTASVDGSKLAYGSKNEIIILSCLNQDPVDINNFKTTVFPIGTKNKITAVQFAPVKADHEYGKFLASSSDDGQVRIWDIEAACIVKYHTGHMTPKASEEIRGMDWSCLDPELLVTVAASGSIVQWKLNLNIINRYTLKSKLSPQCIACSPVNKDLIAIGTKSGLFIVYSFKDSGNILWCLRGHDAEIVSVAWCPDTPLGSELKADSNGKQEGAENRPLIVASASKDCSVVIWKDKQIETVFNLTPPNRGSGMQSIKLVCVRWPQASTLVAGTHQGDLKLLKFSSDPRWGKKPKTSVVDLPVKHNKCVFALTFSPNISDLGAAGDASPPTSVWSASIDRNIIGFNLANPKKQIVIPTLTQIVYCMAFNPINNSQLAIGIGNGEILVWNVSTKTSFDAVFYKNKIMAKVMALAWHPTQENILAFGTGEGRIGLLNTTSKSPPTILTLAHSSSVYTLVWAPPYSLDKNSLKHGFSLFSVGNGEVVENNPDDPNTTPAKLSKTLEQTDLAFGLSMRCQRTELAWNHDSSIIAVGNENGYIHILKGSDWSRIQTLYAHKKIIQSLAWHPKIINDDSLEEVISWKNLLATASHQIKVYDFGDDFNQEPKVIASFSHADDSRVTTVVWSPFIPGRLLSTSYDNSAQIWDVFNRTPIANFPGHSGYVMCGLWSPLDQNAVFTGGADCKVFVWKTTNQQHVKPIERKKRKEMFHKFLITNVLEAKYGNVNFSLDSVSPEQNVNTVEKTSRKPGIKFKTLFPISAPHLTEGKQFGELIDEQKMAELKVTKNGSTHAGSYLQFFGDRNSMVDLMSAEQSKHSQLENLEGEQFCRFWKGDISSLVRDSIHKKQLTEWIVSLAPMASHKLWLEACTSFAFQIAPEQPLRAASYLVAANEIDQAVEILVSKNMHREAVALAKCHYMADDPRVETVVRSWADHAISNGHFSLAAHCYYSINDKMNAITNILKCKDPKLRYHAAILAKEINAPLVVDNIIVDCFIDCLSVNQVSNAKSILNSHPHLNYLNVWLQVYQLVSESLEKTAKSEWTWLCNGLEGETIFFHLNESLKDIILTDKEVIYEKLSKIIECINIDNKNKLTMYVSGQFGLIMSSTDNQTRLNHLACALSCCHNSQIHDTHLYLFRLCMLLYPKGPKISNALDEQFLKASSNLDESNSSFVNSVKFFVCAAVASWFESNVKQFLNDVASEDKLPESTNDSDSCNKKKSEKCISALKKLIALKDELFESDISAPNTREKSSESVVTNGETVLKLTNGVSSQNSATAHSDSNGEVRKHDMLMEQLQMKHVPVPSLAFISNKFNSLLQNEQFANLVNAVDPSLLTNVISEMKTTAITPHQQC